MLHEEGVKTRWGWGECREAEKAMADVTNPEVMVAARV